MKKNLDVKVVKTKYISKYLGGGVSLCFIKVVR